MNSRGGAAVSRAAYACLALALVAFTLYVSLIPFNLRFEPLPLAWAEFWATATSPTQTFSRTNFLANILLFVPLGFALLGAVLAERRPSVLRVTGALLLAASVSVATSVAAEFLQVFAENRVPSGVDVLAQSIGTSIGIVLWALTGSGLTAWLRAAVAARERDRLARVLTAYAALWILANLAPFDITVDVGTLARRFRTGDIVLVPFGSGTGAARLAWDAFAAAISAIPLGLLGAARAAGEARPRLAAFGIGAGIVTLMEIAHIFIRSHSADVTDIVLGSVGVAVGVASAERLLSLDRAHVAVSHNRVRLWAVAALVAWCVVLAAYHWLPYEFAVDGEAIRRKLARMSLVPFSGYRGSDLNALNDVLVKLGLSLPLGFAAALILVPPRRSWVITCAWLVMAATVFGVVEAVQFFVATRIPDPTDILLGVAGTYAGLCVAAYALPSARHPDIPTGSMARPRRERR